MNRTDLAVESEIGGLKTVKRGEFFDIFDVEIDEKTAKFVKKAVGRYVTLSGRDLDKFSEDFQNMVEEFAAEISTFLPKTGNILVIGLGNKNITPDALGSKAIKKILATRHLTQEYPRIFDDLRAVTVIETGVLAQTGIETTEIIEAICKKLQPSLVIVIDSLACNDIKRLGKTIQITNSGISPGSGVGNSRKEISAKTLGTQVLAIGVPTIVDVFTIVQNFTGVEIPQNPNLPTNMLVTPRDIDKLIQKSGELISKAINCALFPNFSYEEINNLMN
jgi:spore protease